MRHPDYTVTTNFKILTNPNSFLSDRPFDEKLATFELTDNHIRIGQETFCSNEVKVEVLRSCKEIETHLHRYRATQLQSANFFFKIDPLNRLYLIQTTRIKVKS